ncbi:hypothetical protein M3172_08870 [Mesobacillus subterraneus]|uniref:hypothetical protein n=1 Tax=Mesobacillus subterraneus TaxID=285983 RepID=UPI0020411BF5|nr:hypothetical protein [Mesobacillus subterraneus]MCM3573306.1 hypothetical protein [Mesobacillus subterraneus]
MIDKRQIENWLCEDCIFVFQTFGKKQRGGRRTYYCPKCGDNVAVTKYVAERYNKSRMPLVWKEEELKVIDQVIKGELLRYQAAIMLGRSIQSVKRKAEKMNEMKAK